MSTFRPWTVWDVSRTKKNSNKNCSNLTTILVFILDCLAHNSPWPHPPPLQKKWYTSCFLIVRRENRPMKMRPRYWCEPGAGPLILPGRELITVNWMGSLTISSVRARQSRQEEISTGGSLSLYLYLNYKLDRLLPSKDIIIIMLFFLHQSTVELRAPSCKLFSDPTLLLWWCLKSRTFNGSDFTNAF